jgi:TorA maturation chaperone TorD
MELFRALAALAEPPTDETVRVVEALDLGELQSPYEYTQLFIFDLYPYASVYLGPEGMLGGEARDRISGFWRALGQTPPAESDHLSVMLAFHARLIDLEQAETDPIRALSWQNSRKAFFWEHVASWLPFYLTKLADIAPPFYKRWSEILMSALREEAQTVGPPSTLSIHLSEQTGLIDPRENPVEDFLQSILTPLRSGIIFTRTDLTAAARTLGLSLRMGERKFILKMLLAQDAQRVFDWLLKEAEAWATRHRSNLSAFAGVSDYWEQKTRDAIKLLEELKLSTNEVI